MYWVSLTKTLLLWQFIAGEKGLAVNTSELEN